jgi:protein-tyrosine phosphatase
VDYSSITADLYIGTTPAAADYEVLHRLGISLVINMRFERRPHRDPNNPPIRHLWLPAIDSPLFPVPIRMLKRGAQAALAEIACGGKVYVHCAGGRHRGVAMGAAILILQGYTADQAMQLIKQRRPQADPYIWYIRWRILKFARAAT